MDKIQQIIEDIEGLKSESFPREEEEEKTLMCKITFVGEIEVVRVPKRLVQHNSL